MDTYRRRSKTEVFICPRKTSGRGELRPISPQAHVRAVASGSSLDRGPALKQLIRTAVCEALDPYLRELVAALSTQLGQEQRMLADYLAAKFTALAERLVRHEGVLARILKLHVKKPGAPFQNEN